MKSLILGYGNTGQSVKKYFDTTSKEYLIHDDNLDLLKDIGEELVFKDSHLEEVDEIVVSPGINPDHQLLKEFPENNVITDIDLFSNEFKGTFIGVTGTNGKTTFVNLLSNFLNENIYFIFFFDFSIFMARPEIVPFNPSLAITIVPLISFNVRNFCRRALFFFKDLILINL